MGLRFFNEFGLLKVAHCCFLRIGTDESFRSTSMAFILDMAFAGLSPFGQVWVQFMIV